MTRRHRSGKFKAQRMSDAVPLLNPAVSEISRAAQVLSERARAAKVARAAKDRARVLWVAAVLNQQLGRMG